MIAPFGPKTRQRKYTYEHVYKPPCRDFKGHRQKMESGWVTLLKLISFYQPFLGKAIYEHGQIQLISYTVGSFNTCQFALMFCVRS